MCIISYPGQVNQMLYYTGVASMSTSSPSLLFFCNVSFGSLSYFTLMLGSPDFVYETHADTNYLVVISTGILFRLIYKLT